VVHYPSDVSALSEARFREKFRVGRAFRCAFDKAVYGELSSAANWDNETCHYGHT
jgi:hypothetical protein